ncbi:MAG: DUF362 domain-containing protein [archaeon]|nr:DUF362 domain-containing protein [archaeon]
MESKPKVYFTKTIAPEKLVELFKLLNKELPGKVAVKVHSGEAGNKNFIKPEFMKPMIDFLKGTVIEANSGGDKSIAHITKRNTTESHKKVIEEHGWTKYFNVEILDEKGEFVLKNDKAYHIKENIVGEGIKNYDSCLVISHFKGHGAGGYGGALKQLSIGFASTLGKTYIHSGGTNKDLSKFFQCFCDSITFKESMADAAWTIVDYFKGKMAFINIMANISVDCDCANNAKPPCMKDIGILASTDPVAIDAACLDIIYNSEDPGKKELIERIESLHGAKIIEASVNLGTGRKDYELIKVD